LVRSIGVVKMPPIDVEVSYAAPDGDREPVPPETARVARAAFPTGNRDLTLADEMETLCTDDTFQALFPTHGQPALSPWRLALVTLLPFAEGLSDRQAAEDEATHLITHVETMRGPTADGAATPKIHAALQQRGLLPGTPIVDPGFLDADLLVRSQERYGVDLLGPTRLDDHWQAQYQLDPHRGQLWPCRHHGAVFHKGLSAPSPSSALGALSKALSAADGHHPPPAAISSLTSRTAARSDGDVSGGIRPPRWH
jgi:hypothetical protein